MISYVSSRITSFLGLTNIWTGVSNTFNYIIYNSDIRSLNATTNLKIGANLTSGEVRIGPTGPAFTALIGEYLKFNSNAINHATSGQLLLGNLSSSVKIGSDSIFTQLGTSMIFQNNDIDLVSGSNSTLRLANQYANALELGNTTIPVRSGYIALSGNDVMNYSTALTMTNTLLTNTTNDWTNTLNKFENQLQNDNLQALAGTSAMLVGTGLVAGGSLAMGSYLSTVQAGGYTLLGDGLDMAATSPSLAMKIGGLTATSVTTDRRSRNCCTNGIYGNFGK